MNLDNIFNMESLKSDLENILFDLGKEINVHKINEHIILDINYHATINKIINILENNIINQTKN